MEPMKPMEPVKPMRPMAPPERWWPEGLGDPASVGTQNGMRYAYFPEARRLLVEAGGRLSIYDSGEHRISGVSQSDASERNLTFASQLGPVDLHALKALDEI